MSCLKLRFFSNENDVWKFLTMRNLYWKSGDIKRVRLSHHEAATSNKNLNSEQSNRYHNQLLKPVKTK
jgi:hypothetical protein